MIYRLSLRQDGHYNIFGTAMMINKNFFRKLWLCTSMLLIILILFIGGITRLTNSGLSITEWKPVTGILPPFNETAWLKERAKYELTPEYQHINNNISTYEFKTIYMIEYTHRLVARIAGMVFILPLTYFLVMRIFKKRYIGFINYRVCIVFILGIMQAFFGWYMVKSGLISDPHVSHYRLALHFCTALLIISLLWYEFYTPKININNKFLFILVINIIFFIFVQGILGAFMAGLKAGMIYNTFPLMEGELIPKDLFVTKDLSFMSVFSSNKFVQFMHRANGMLILLLSMSAVAIAYFREKKALNDTIILLLLVSLQLILGIVTLLYQLPIVPAAIHQFLIVLILMQSIALLSYKIYNPL